MITYKMAILGAVIIALVAFYFGFFVAALLVAAKDTTLPRK